MMHSQTALWQRLKENEQIVERMAFVAMLLLFCLLLGRYALDLSKTLTASSRLVDFEAYLYAAKAITLDENPYTYNHQFGILAYRYPPTLAILLVPLTKLSPLTAQRIWQALNQLLLWSALVLSLRAAGKRFSRCELLLLGCITFGFYALYINLKLGQMGIILYFSVALTYGLWQKEKRVLAGLCLGLSGALKVIPLGLLVYFLWKREYRIVLSGTISFLVIQLAPDIIFGTTWLQKYLETFSSFYRQENPLYYANQSFYGFFARFFEAMRRTSTGDPLFIARAAAFIAGVLVFMVSLVLSRRDQHPPDTGAAALEMGGILIAITLLNPISWHHYFAWLLFIFPALIRYLSERIRSTSRFQGLALLTSSLAAFVLLSQPLRLPRMLGYQVDNPGLVAALLSSLVLYGTLIIWGIVILLLQTLHQQEHSSRAKIR